MYLSRFGVKNYKCLGEIDIPLTPIHVLIGENDAGKTSLLEAMAALYASAHLALSQAFPEPWDGRELVLHGAQEPQVSFDACWNDLDDQGFAVPSSEVRYSIHVDFGTEGKGLRGERQIIVDGRSTSIRNLGTTLLQFREKAVEEVFHAVDTLCNLMKPAHMYSFNARSMAIPSAIDPDRKFRLDFDGFGLATLLDDILGYDAERFIQLRNEFCHYFPQFKSVRVESVPALRRVYGPQGIRGSNEASGKGIFFETQSGQTIRAQQASDGAILFLGFLALAHIPYPPSLLLIEEPENAIYPKRLGEVITLLKELVHRTEGVRFPQIIMSTHSPYVLSSFEPEEVTFLSRSSEKPDAPVRARPLRDAPNVREGGFYLGELWYNLSEEELFGDA